MCRSAGHSWQKACMPASRLIDDPLQEIRRLATGTQRRAGRTPEVAPLIARFLANCQTFSIELRAGGLIEIRLRARNGRDIHGSLTCVIHRDELLPLSPTELQVARQLCEGRTLAQIGRLRGVSVNTLKSQVRQIFRKLDVDTRVALVRRLG